MIRLNEEIGDHPKFVGLPGEACWMWVRCIGYARRNKTDGYVPSKVCLGFADSPYRARHLVRLLSVPSQSAPHLGPLLDECPGGYRVHDYLDFNPSKTQIDEESRKKAEVGRAGGRASGEARGKHAASIERRSMIHDPDPRSMIHDPERDPASPASTPSNESASNEKPPEGSFALVPPVTETKTRKPRVEARTRAPSIAETAGWVLDKWLVDQKLPTLASDDGAEVERFLDFHSARGTLAASWSATWRTWRGNWTESGGTITRRTGAARCRAPSGDGLVRKPPRDLQRLTNAEMDAEMARFAVRK